MGIDIYARWREMTEKERLLQINGFSTNKGDVGYLRESYNGSQYATMYLLKEAFNEDEDEVSITSRVLGKRLVRTLEIVEERVRNLYKGNRTEEQLLEEINYTQKAFIDFVALCKKKERETGEACKIIASF